MPKEVTTTDIPKSRDSHSPPTFRWTLGHHIMSRTARWEFFTDDGGRWTLNIPNVWLTLPSTWDAFVAEWGEHRSCIEKEGFAFFPGVLTQGSAESQEALRALRTRIGDLPYATTANVDRCTANVAAMTMLVLDYDKGASFEDVIDCARGLGLEFLAYTSFSHGKSITVISKRQIVKFCGTNDVTDEIARRYLKEKNGYADDIAGSASIVEEAQDADGVLWLTVSHAPMDKFRIVFPLAEPYSGDADGWRRLYTRFADQLGFPYDKSGSVLCQAFYLPSCPPGSRPRCVRGRGTWLNFEDWQDEKSVSKPDGKKPASKKPATIVKSARVSNGAASTANINLRGVRIASILAEHADDIVTGTPTSHPKKVQLICPFADTHTQERGRDTRGGCWAQDPPTSTEYGRVRCSHDHCRERLSEDFVAAWLEDGTLETMQFAHSLMTEKRNVAEKADKLREFLK